jgi:hypothetical protein
VRGTIVRQISAIIVTLCAGSLPATAQDALRAAQYDAELPDDAAEAVAEEAATEAEGLVGDGDLAREGLDANALLRDGLMDDDPRDEPLEAGPRPAEDTALFAVPDTASDPLLFQIEDIDTIGGSDRRPARLALLEPYDPVGIRLGSFLLFPEAEIGALWTDNVLKSQTAASDKAVEIAPAARLVSNWSRHALELRGAADLSWFDEFETEDDRGYLAEARARLDVTRRTNLQALLSHEVAQESRSAIDASLVGDRTDVATSRGGLTFNQRFNRMRVQLRGALADTDYAPSNGASNAERDVRSSEEAARVSWEFKPTLTAFVDAGINQRDYAAAAGDGLRRSSDGERLRAGFDLGSTSRTWRGEISIGWGRQTADESALGAADAFLVDANLAWRPTALTSLLLTARSEIDDTITPGAAFAVSRSGGLEIRHALRRYVVASAGISYLDRRIDGTSFAEDEWRGGLGLEYFLSREAIVFGRYQHIVFDSTQPVGDWTADELRVGVKVRR